MSRKLPLTIEVKDAEIQIRIGLGTLRNCAEQSEAFNPFDDKLNDFWRQFKVTDETEFAKGVVRFLRDEDEIGHTVITRALDDGIVAAIEGADGVEQLHQRAEKGTAP